MTSIAPLTVPGQLASLKAVRDYVMDAATQAGLDRTKANRMRLAVDEIVTNSIVHGYDESGLEGDVRVEAHISDNDLTIIVEDWGPHYDPTAHDIPTEADLVQPLDTREIGGLGIFLTVKGMDEFRYERVDDRNRNIFVLRRTGNDS